MAWRVLLFFVSFFVFASCTPQPSDADPDTPPTSRPDTGDSSDTSDTSAPPADLGVDSGSPDATRDTLTDAQTAPSGPWRSELFPADWTPEFTHPDGWFLHDFSYAGYHHSERPLPTGDDLHQVDVIERGADATGQVDATGIINAAIEGLGAMGGVIYFGPGLFRIEGQLRITADHVVLRGAGSTRTQLFFPTPAARSQHSHIVFGSGSNLEGDWPLHDDAPNRARRFTVADASGLRVGDDIAIGWVISPEFVVEHGMEENWRVFNGEWQPFFRRSVVAIEPTSSGDTIIVDVPIRYPARTRDSASIRREVNLTQEVGMEGLAVGDAIDWESAWRENQTHVVEFHGVKNGWIRDVASFRPPSAPDAGPGADAHLRSGGLMIRASKQITARDVSLERAQHLGPGGNGYLFEVRASSEVLIRDSVGRLGRHNFIQNWGFGTTGMVWLRVRSEAGRAWRDQSGRFATTGYSEFHHSLAMANLIDSSSSNDGWSAVNRKDYSSGAGHTATQTVFWNTTGTGGVRSWQYGRGYVIGTGEQVEVFNEPLDIDLGPLAGWDGTQPNDWLEGEGRSAHLEPASLFEAQLSLRLSE